MVDSPLLSLRSLRVQMGSRVVLQGLDLDLGRGEVLALLGASGCGKTTLLRSVAGLVPPSGGQVLLDGRDIGALPPQQRGLGVVFQSYALFPNLPVLENVEFGPLADGMKPAQARARALELLALVDLLPLAAQRPAQLSGGQRQRVALARALARHPALLLMDEPFSALDENFRAPLRQAFRRLQLSLRQSCLLVTHDREEAYELADRVALMVDGRIAQCASPAELWTRPASRQVAEFLGAFNVLPSDRRPGSAAGAWWSAPVAHCRLRTEGEVLQDQDWCLRVRVTDLARGSTRQVLSLAAEGAGPLSVWLELGRVAPSPGDWVDLVLPAAHLHPLRD